MSGLLIQWNVGIIEMIFFAIFHQNIYKVKEILCGKIIKTTGIKIHSQHWVVHIQLSLKVLSVEYFPNSIDPGSNKNTNFIHI